MTDLREDIQAALAAIPSSDFLTTTENLLAVLGYRSERTLAGQTGAVADFIAQFPAAKEALGRSRHFAKTSDPCGLSFR